MYVLKREFVAANRNREQPKRVCDTCGSPLDNLGSCPRCLLRRMDHAKTLRIKQRNKDLFREIDKIVTKAW